MDRVHGAGDLRRPPGDGAALDVRGDAVLRPAHQAQNASSRCSMGCSASPPPRRRNRIVVLPGGCGEGYQRRALPSGVGASMSMGGWAAGSFGGRSVQVVRARTESGRKGRQP